MSEQDTAALHKRIEELEARLASLEASDERYRLVSERASDFVYSLVCCDEQAYKMEWVSASFFRVTGFAFEDICGRDHWQLMFAPEDRPYLADRVQSLFEGKPPQASTTRLIKKDGTVRWVRFQATGVTKAGEGTVERVVGSAQDVTELVEAEAALRRSEARHRAMLNALPDMVLLVDNAHVVLDCHAWTLGEHFQSPLQILGKRLAEVMPPAVAVRYDECFKRLRETDEPQSMEYSLGGPDALRDYEARAVVCDEERLLVMVRDVTANKRAAREADVQRSQLIQASRLASLGTLAGGIAHEINNPNHVILGNASLLAALWPGVEAVLERYYEVNGDYALGSSRYSRARVQVPRMYDAIREASERIRKIVDELRDYARETPPGTSDVFDVPSLVASCQALTGNLLRKATSRFEVCHGPDLPEVCGQRQRIEQVLITLLQNACQALTDMEQSVVITTSYEAERHMVCIEVTDQGEGIAPEDLPHVKDPFYTTRRASGHVGLGLSIAAMIMDENGGVLELQSVLGEGTRAIILVPEASTA